MPRNKEIGVCCLCLEEGPLTFEHVPPEAAFNDRPVIVADINRLIGGDLFKLLEAQQGRQSQRGAGGHSLCRRCNNNTGAWYARAYVDLVHAAMPFFGEVRAGQAGIVSTTLRPLRVLKQILTMFCSACGPGFVRAHRDVARYLLDRESRRMPGGIELYLALLDHKTMATRQSGVSGRIDLETGHMDTYSEISFPPFDIVMGLGSQRSPDERLARITWFNQFSIDDERQIQLALHCVQTNTYLPGDYSIPDKT